MNVEDVNRKNKEKDKIAAGIHKRSFQPLSNLLCASAVLLLINYVQKKIPYGCIRQPEINPN